jgi:hypothetical protein
VDVTDMVTLLPVTILSCMWATAHINVPNMPSHNSPNMV